MERLFFSAIWLFLYGYYVEQAGTVQKGKGKRAAAFVLAASLFVLLFWLPYGIVWLLVSGLFLLYDLFFDEEGFGGQWWRMLLPGLAFSLCISLPVRYLFLSNGALLFVLFLLLAQKRGFLRGYSAFLTAAIYGLLSTWLFWCGTAPFWRLGGIALELLLFLALEGTLFSYQRGFEQRTERFQKDVMGHQYEEIKSIYLNMRGWRHDYHNHLQVMKAQLDLGNAEEARQYLDELERDLERVDTYVKSGNLMVDAILNSKLSLAQQKRIAVNCKAQVPEALSVEDVDLCVILGNLLDNAIEACEQIAAEQRFLRIYMAVNKSQLYLSVQNAAKEELSFDERHYITNKRGSHGFGMRRVKAMVDKYEGFLNLANEPGIFAAEVTMPLEKAGCAAGV